MRHAKMNSVEPHTYCVEPDIALRVAPGPERIHSVLRGACPAAGAGRHVREVAHAVLYGALLPVSDSGMQAQWYVPGKDEVTRDNESFRTIRCGWSTTH